jgi:hypothetical protein
MAQGPHRGDENSTESAEGDDDRVAADMLPTDVHGAPDRIDPRCIR